MMQVFIGTPACRNEPDSIRRMTRVPPGPEGVLGRLIGIQTRLSRRLRLDLPFPSRVPADRKGGAGRGDIRADGAGNLGEDSIEFARLLIAIASAWRACRFHPRDRVDRRAAVAQLDIE